MNSPVFIHSFTYLHSSIYTGTCPLDTEFYQIQAILVILN